MKVSKRIKYLQDLEREGKDIDVQVQIIHQERTTLADITAVVYNGTRGG